MSKRMNEECGGTLKRVRSINKTERIGGWLTDCNGKYMGQRMRGVKEDGIKRRKTGGEERGGKEEERRKREGGWKEEEGEEEEEEREEEE
jgi:hypothetical protein